MRPYRNFVLMIAVASVLMYALMYLNTWRASDVWFSWSRLFMAMIMAGTMALVMLGFMRHMYRDRHANTIIVMIGVALVVAGTVLVRTQATVGDVAYMKAMIPHHSIAVLTSSRARIRDPRVRKLADGIIASQQREIVQMEALVEDIERSGVQGRQ
jgi:branched-subunit amino acid ABC-type transport system permease component